MFTIGDKIKYFRRKRMMTQAELAKISDIHPVSIRKYETNKMQPQPAQIERLALALQVSVGALNGAYMDIVNLNTKGDLMGLLITWHKAGILRIEGTRSDGDHLDIDSVRFVLHPILKKYMALSSINEKKEEIITLDDLSIVMHDFPDLKDLIRWESLYNSYALLSARYRDSDSEHLLSILNELRDRLELIEMEMQSSTERLR